MILRSGARTQTLRPRRRKEILCKNVASGIEPTNEDERACRFSVDKSAAITCDLNQEQQQMQVSTLNSMCTSDDETEHSKMKIEHGHPRLHTSTLELQFSEPHNIPVQTRVQRSEKFATWQCVCNFGVPLGLSSYTCALTLIVFLAALICIAFQLLQPTCTSAQMEQSINYFISSNCRKWPEMCFAMKTFLQPALRAHFIAETYDASISMRQVPLIVMLVTPANNEAATRSLVYDLAQLLYVSGQKIHILDHVPYHTTQITPQKFATSLKNLDAFLPIPSISEGMVFVPFFDQYNRTYAEQFQLLCDDVSPKFKRAFYVFTIHTDFNGSKPEACLHLPKSDAQALLSRYDSSPLIHNRNIETDKNGVDMYDEDDDNSSENIARDEYKRYVIEVRRWLSKRWQYQEEQSDDLMRALAARVVQNVIMPICEV